MKELTSPIKVYYSNGVTSKQVLYELQRQNWSVFYDGYDDELKYKIVVTKHKDNADIVNRVWRVEVFKKEVA